MSLSDWWHRRRERRERRYGVKPAERTVDEAGIIARVDMVRLEEMPVDAKRALHALLGRISVNTNFVASAWMFFPASSSRSKTKKPSSDHAPSGDRPLCGRARQPPSRRTAAICSFAVALTASLCHWLEGFAAVMQIPEVAPCPFDYLGDEQVETHVLRVDPLLLGSRELDQLRDQGRHLEGAAAALLYGQDIRGSRAQGR